MKVGIVIATKGRRDLVHKTVNEINKQTVLPDILCLSCSSIEDVDESLIDTNFPVNIIYSSIGSSAQRNAGMAQINLESIDYLVFIDDDFVMRTDWIENMIKVFADMSIAGINGFLIRDGAREKSGGISFENALMTLNSFTPHTKPISSQISHLYGCNMAFRVSMIDNLKFDERLPLYSWLEDIDFSHNVGLVGKLVSCSSLVGVHMGSKSGKTSDWKYGVSQILNSVYLHRKGSLSTPLLVRFTILPLIKNSLMSFIKSPYVDYRLRFKGNLFAVKRLLSGKCDPEVITLTSG